jgi:hypothetical protein
MSGLSVEDFKQLLLDLYLVQRENAVLRAELMARQEPEEGDEVD